MQKFRLSGLWLALVCLGLVLPVVLSRQETPGFRLTILYANDFHGANFARLARQATMIKEIRAKERNVLVLNGGDVFTRGPYHHQFYGKLEFEVLNALRTDALTLGNNEFKATKDRSAVRYLYDRLNQAKFPVLCANVLKDGAYLPKVKPYIVKQLGGVKIGIMGVSTNQIRGYEQTQGLVVRDQFETARRIYPKVAAQAEIVLALTHIGYGADRFLAEQIPTLALIVGAHSHTVLQEPVTVGKVPIVQAGAKGKYLGRIDLTFGRAGGKWILKHYTGRLIEMDKTIKEDPEIKAIIDRYLAPLTKEAA